MGHYNTIPNFDDEPEGGHYNTIPNFDDEPEGGHYNTIPNFDDEPEGGHYNTIPDFGATGGAPAQRPLWRAHPGHPAGDGPPPRREAVAKKKVRKRVHFAE